MTHREDVESRPATLAKILQSREDRARRQKELLDRHGGVVISFTPVAPGAEKTALRFFRIHQAGRAAILAVLKEADLPILYEDSRKNPGGFESLFAVTGDPEDVKKRMMQIEETHPLGRLFDIDVLGPGGQALGRSDLGQGPRKCLLCGRPAAECARSKAHPLDQLLSHIDELLRLAEARPE